MSMRDGSVLRFSLRLHPIGRRGGEQRETHGRYSPGGQCSHRPCWRRRAFVDFHNQRPFVASLGNADDVVLRRGSDKIRPGTDLNVEIATPQKGS
jgi:hypothetical protein